uniref:Uncharacterized protein n=1 Tax=Micrurus corallinus TaxID=54390 RepID=A0A2D4EYH9_MICCO
MKRRLIYLDLKKKKILDCKNGMEKDVVDLLLKMPEHENDTENNAKMDLQVNQKSDLESLNTLDLQKESVVPRKFLLIRDKEELIKLFLAKDKKNVIRTQLMGYCLMGLKVNLKKINERKFTVR